MHLKVMDTKSKDCTLGATHDIEVLSSAMAGEILTLQRAAYIGEAAVYRDFELPPLIETMEQVCADLDDGDVKVIGLRERGRLLGVVRLRRVGTVIKLGRLAVAPDRQGQGIATTLLRHAEKVFAEAVKIELFTGAQSIANIRLYLRCGYKETGRTFVDGHEVVQFVKTP